MAKIENIVKYEGLGAVKYVRSKRAKNLSIRINAGAEVRVTMPYHVSQRKAEGFVMRKSSWITKKINELDQSRNQFSIPVYQGRLQVRGQTIPLRLETSRASMEEAIWSAILPEAKSYLPHRVAVLAHQFGYSYKGLKIRRMKTRWGSCTSKNSINLNSWLVMLPDHLADYVILHELVHTIHKDHGAGFWKELDRATGGKAKALRNELKKRPIMSVYPVE